MPERSPLVYAEDGEDDLGGRILETDRDGWRVVEIPMEAYPDDPLGP